ncbi:PH domain-containing protein [Nocardioides sp. NPDC126508]
MLKQEKVVAFVGLSWAASMGVGVLWGLTIWAAGFLDFRGVLPVPLGAVMGVHLVLCGAVFAAWLLLFRSRLEVSDEGLALSGPLGSRVIPWSELVVVEPSWGWLWVRCRDSRGRATLRLTTSRLHPRLQRHVRRDNKELATRLWYASRTDSSAVE